MNLLEVARCMYREDRGLIVVKTGIGEKSLSVHSISGKVAAEDGST